MTLLSFPDHRACLESTIFLEDLAYTLTSGSINSFWRVLLDSSRDIAMLVERLDRFPVNIFPKGNNCSDFSPLSIICNFYNKPWLLRTFFFDSLCLDDFISHNIAETNTWLEMGINHDKLLTVASPNSENVVLFNGKYLSLTFLKNLIQVQPSHWIFAGWYENDFNTRFSALKGMDICAIISEKTFKSKRKYLQLIDALKYSPNEFRNSFAGLVHCLAISFSLDNKVRDKIIEALVVHLGSYQHDNDFDFAWILGAYPATGKEDFFDTTVCSFNGTWSRASTLFADLIIIWINKFGINPLPCRCFRELDEVDFIRILKSLGKHNEVSNVIKYLISKQPFLMALIVRNDYVRGFVDYSKLIPIDYRILANAQISLGVDNYSDHEWWYEGKNQSEDKFLDYLKHRLTTINYEAHLTTISVPPEEFGFRPSYAGFERLSKKLPEVVGKTNLRQSRSPDIVYRPHCNDFKGTLYKLIYYSVARFGKPAAYLDCEFCNIWTEGNITKFNEYYGQIHNFDVKSDVTRRQFSLKQTKFWNSALSARNGFESKLLKGIPKGKWCSQILCGTRRSDDEKSPVMI